MHAAASRGLGLQICQPVRRASLEMPALPARCSSNDTHGQGPALLERCGRLPVSHLSRWWSTISRLPAQKPPMLAKELPAPPADRNVNAVLLVNLAPV